MKRAMIFLVFAYLVFWLPAMNLEAAPAAGRRVFPNSPAEEKEHLSPYFFVPGDAEVDSFPLLRTGAGVDIAGVIAEVELTQVYKNDGKKTIEAIYVFPLGTKSAIHALKMKIGERIIEAKIEERKKAEKIYQAAKDEGKVASLLQQERPNVFQMKVANIMPGDVVEVKVKYTELLVPEDGIYEFVFPTVVGPRFTGEKSGEDLRGKDGWTVSPYLHQGEEAPYQFDIRVNINAPMPLAAVSVPSHRTEISWPTPGEAEISLAEEERKGGNRDFIVRYSLEGKAIQTGLLLYPGEEEKFFLLMMEPPEKVSMEMVPPREYVFIVDVSGSMNGFPLEVSKTLIRRIIENLRKEDYFNILFFAGGSSVLSPNPLPATEGNKEKAIEMLLSRRGGGGTRILDAMKRAIALEKKEGLSRIIVIATDGYVAVEKETFDIIRENPGRANFFAFGIGSGVNRYIIEGIARVGNGAPFIATDKEEAEKMAEKFTRYVERPLLTDIEVKFEGFDAYDVEPPNLADLFAERPLVLFGKYREASGRVEIKGKTAAGDYENKIEVSADREDGNNTALKYLWAREKIARLSDYGKAGSDVREEVTDLGLKYHLMTEYTSFVAVDTVIRDTGEAVTVKQPLPLPAGVSDYAVGMGRGSVLGLRMKAMAPQMLSEEAVYQREDKKVPAQIYLSGAKLPAGITLDEVEKIILQQIKGDLGEVFQKWELESLTVLLKLEKGKVVDFRLKAFRARECGEEVLEKIFRKLSFPVSLQGPLELKLEYI